MVPPLYIQQNSCLLPPPKSFSSTRFHKATTMKQKIVVKVSSMNDLKSRSKALKIVVGVPGVVSAAIGKKDKNQIEVTGEGIDAVELTTLLRTKLGDRSCFCLTKNEVYAEIISVAPIKDKEEEGGKVVAMDNWPWSCGYGMPHYFICYD